MEKQTKYPPQVLITQQLNKTINTMNDKRKLWTIGAIIAAIILIGILFLYNTRVEKAVDEQGQEVLEDLTID